MTEPGDPEDPSSSPSPTPRAFDANDAPTAPMPSKGGDLGGAPGSESDLSAYEAYLGRDDPKAGPAANPWEEAAGDRIDQYELIEAVGRGTFGAVWRARDTKLSRTVAIKLIRPGMDTPDFIARFKQEQQVLAALEHPNIATVFGEGVSPKGTPYFAMEFVEGAPITRFCDRERLDIRQRLEVFLDVCRAVQFAHTNNIAHRDLKPANVLVEYTQTRQIRPVVIDFGLAKALAPGALGGAVQTGQFVAVGTPDYMSPEQASPYGQGIDNRTDVYALGVMLYELLAGTRPFDFSGLSSETGWSEVQRILRDVEPPAPSTKLSTIASSDEQLVEEIARARRLPVDALAGTLSRELQWIPLKAMKKDRAERYGTVQELADDIQRYLDGLPVKAAPDSAWYRARKFVRRNRVGLSVAAVIAGLAVGAVVLGVRERISQARLEVAQKRSVLLAEQREQAISFASEYPVSREELSPSQFAALADQTKRSARLWMVICDRPESDDPALPNDLARLAHAALGASRYSDSIRLNTTGLGDPESASYWMAVADGALARLDAIGGEPELRPALAASRARTELDLLALRQNDEAAIEEGERVLRELVPALARVAADESNPILRHGLRDARLIETVLSDRYQFLAEKLLDREPPPTAEILRLVDRAAELLERQVVARRSRADASDSADPVGERKDLAVAIERLSRLKTDERWLALRSPESARALVKAGLELREEYFRRFVETVQPGDDIGEMNEYAGGLMRFLDADLHKALQRYSEDPASYNRARSEYTSATERAVKTYLEAMWRNAADLRSYEQLIILLQRCLTPKRMLDPSTMRALLDAIHDVGVVPPRILGFESLAPAKVRDAMLAIRIAVDSRRGLFARGDPPVAGDEARLDEARVFVERGFATARDALRGFSAKSGASAGGTPSSALLAEIELAFALARQFELPGADEQSKSLELLRGRGDFAQAFSSRPRALYFWFELEMASCSKPLRQSPVDD